MSDARRRVAWEEMFDLAARSRCRARRCFESAPAVDRRARAPLCGEMCAMRTVNNIMDGLVIDLDNE